MLMQRDAFTVVVGVAFLSVSGVILVLEVFQPYVPFDGEDGPVEQVAEMGSVEHVGIQGQLFRVFFFLLGHQVCFLLFCCGLG